MSYCEYKEGKKSSCSRTSDPTKNSDKCEINPKTKRCVIKKLVTKSKIKTKKNSTNISSTKSFADFKCSNDEDPITFSNFQDDDVSPDNIIALPFKDGKTLCFEDDTIWSMFSNHVNHQFDILKRASKNDFSNIPPIDMSVWGVQTDLLKIDVAKNFIQQRAKSGLAKKEFLDPNSPYKARGNTTQAKLENFLVDRIDPKNTIHVEFLVSAILGTHHMNDKNISNKEWKTLVEVIYGSWVSPASNDIQYLKSLTTSARTKVSSSAYSVEEKRNIFIQLLIDMYNEILKKSSADTARGKLTMLLWALQTMIQE